jgi:hypothetical protein
MTYVIWGTHNTTFVILLPCDWCINDLVNLCCVTFIRNITPNDVVNKINRGSMILKSHISNAYAIYTTMWDLTFIYMCIKIFPVYAYTCMNAAYTLPRIPRARHCIAYQNFSFFPFIEFRLLHIIGHPLWSYFKL